MAYYKNPYNDPQFQDQYLRKTERFCDSYHKHYSLIEKINPNQWTFACVACACITVILLALIIIH